MPGGGFEPPRLAAAVFETATSTDSVTPAGMFWPGEIYPMPNEGADFIRQTLAVGMLAAKIFGQYLLPVVASHLSDKAFSTAYRQHQRHDGSLLPVAALSPCAL